MRILGPECGAGVNIGDLFVSSLVRSTSYSEAASCSCFIDFFDAVMLQESENMIERASLARRYLMTAKKTVVKSVCKEHQQYSDEELKQYEFDSDKGDLLCLIALIFLHSHTSYSIMPDLMSTCYQRPRVSQNKKKTKTYSYNRRPAVIAIRSRVNRSPTDPS